MIEHVICCFLVASTPDGNIISSTTFLFERPSGIFSTTSSVRVETYEQVTKRQAGIAVTADDNVEIANSTDSDDVSNSFFPFQNEVDYALAL
jgi:hypothetical protein